MFPHLKALEDMIASFVHECSSLPADATSSILFTASADRANRLEGLEATQQLVDDCLPRVREMQKSLSAALQHLDTHRANAIHARSSVSALATETLRSIFRLAFSSDVKAATARYLSHTCSRWRALIVATPDAWQIVPVTAKTRTNLIALYAERSISLPLTLRLLGSGGYSTSITVPPFSKGKEVLVELTDKDHMEWLNWPDSRPASLRLGRIGSLGGNTAFGFYDHDDKHYDHYSGVNTLIFHASSFSNTVEKRTYFCGRNLHFESMCPSEVCELMFEIETGEGRCSELWLTDLDPYFMGGDDNFNAVTSELRGLHITGDRWSVAAAGYLLEDHSVRWFNSLEIQVREQLEHGAMEKVECEAWPKGIQAIVTFAADASEISIASPPSQLTEILEFFVTQAFPKLETLSLLLSDVDPYEPDLVASITLAGEAVRRLIAKQVDGLAELIPHVRVSRALVGDAREWFEARSGSLEVR